jgi:phosphoribosyl-ATP pyrophosphohydrolase
LTPADVIAELERREGTSGIEEKALRKAVLRAESEK